MIFSVIRNGDILETINGDFLEAVIHEEEHEEYAEESSQSTTDAIPEENEEEEVSEKKNELELVEEAEGEVIIFNLREREISPLPDIRRISYPTEIPQKSVIFFELKKN